ncbi:putative prolyl-tRNA synthetase associated domain-containing protein 1 [Manis javanica]|nr:putative prolyl-tRNA synthetase associated domain-containing protein 1 [Manis javanica]
MAAAELREALELRLDQLAIRTEVVEHPEVFTVEEMMPHIQHLKGAHSGHEKVYFHPMTNAATMGLSPEDFLTFVKKTGHDPIILNFDGNNKLG